jgi:hypothetical protein
MNDPASSSAPIRKRRGCLFYGCLTLVVLLLVFCLLAFLTVRWIGNRVNAYTDTAPMEMPRVEMADTEMKALEQRMDSFGVALEKGKTAETLVLTEREINALITRKSGTTNLANRVYVSLKDNQVKGQISLPLNGIPLIGKGRYLNGEAVFHVSLDNGVLIVTADQVKVKGIPLPETFMKEVRKENLAKDAYNDAESARIIRKLESIQVENGRAVIKPRAPAQ